MVVSVEDQARIVLILVGVIFTGMIFWTLWKASPSFEKSTLLVGAIYISLSAMVLEAYLQIKFELLALLLIGFTMLCIWSSYKQWKINRGITKDYLRRSKEAKQKRRS